MRGLGWHCGNMLCLSLKLKLHLQLWDRWHMLIEHSGLDRTLMRLVSCCWLAVLGWDELILSWLVGKRCIASLLCEAFRSIDWPFEKEPVAWMWRSLVHSFLSIQLSQPFNFQFAHVTWPTVFMPRESFMNICVNYFGESIRCISKDISLGSFVRSCLMLWTDWRPSWLTFISFCSLSFWQMMHSCNCDSSDTGIVLVVSVLSAMAASPVHYWKLQHKMLLILLCWWVTTRAQ